jgi:hypothetical protein
MFLESPYPYLIVSIIAGNILSETLERDRWWEARRISDCRDETEVCSALWTPFWTELPGMIYLTFHLCNSYINTSVFVENNFYTCPIDCLNECYVFQISPILDILVTNMTSLAVIQTSMGDIKYRLWEWHLLKVSFTFLWILIEPEWDSYDNHHLHSFMEDVTQRWE